MDTGFKIKVKLFLPSLAKNISMLLFYADKTFYDGETLEVLSGCFIKHGKGILSNLRTGSAAYTVHEYDKCIESWPISKGECRPKSGASGLSYAGEMRANSGYSKSTNSRGQSANSAIESDNEDLDYEKLYQDLQDMCFDNLYEGFAILLNQFELDINWIYQDGKTLLSKCIVIIHFPFY